jgi:hypothetical protein
MLRCSSGGRGILRRIFAAGASTVVLIYRTRGRDGDRLGAAFAEEHGRDVTQIGSLPQLGAVGIAFRREIEATRALRAHLPATDGDGAVRFDNPLAGIPGAGVPGVDGV